MPDAQNTTGTDTQLTGGQGFPADNRDGTPGLIGKDDFTIQYETNRLTRGRVVPLAGNIADMQRLGALIADNKATAGVAVNPTVDVKDESIVTPAQHDAAKGEWTVESEREGLVKAPPAPVPAENKEPNSIDPGSVSPTVEAKSSTSTSTSPKPQSK